MSALRGRGNPVVRVPRGALGAFWAALSTSPWDRALRGIWADAPMAA